jgi:hypothetical protein
MNRLIVVSLLLGLGCARSTPAPTQPPVPVPVVLSVPRFPMVVTCYIGPANSGRSCTAGPVDGNPNVNPNATWKAGIRCGDSGGKISEIEWQLLGQRGESDLYRIVCRFPADDPSPQVTTKEVEFSGKRAIVFQDEFHTIVIDSPKQ